MRDKWLKFGRYSLLTCVILYAISGASELITISYILMRRYSLRYFVASLRLSLYTTYLGSILTLVNSVLGWKAILKSRPVIIKVFASIAILIACFGITGCIWVFLEQEDMNRTCQDILTAKFPTNGVENEASWWDTIQEELKCCGVNGPHDYKTHIPRSCTSNSTPGLYTQGCVMPFIHIMRDDFNMAALCLLLISLFQIAMGFLTWAYANRIGNGQLELGRVQGRGPGSLL